MLTSIGFIEKGKTVIFLIEFLLLIHDKIESEMDNRRKEGYVWILPGLSQKIKLKQH